MVELIDWIYLSLLLLLLLEALIYYRGSSGTITFDGIFVGILMDPPGTVGILTGFIEFIEFELGKALLKLFENVLSKNLTWSNDLW